jgi:molybdopterin-guanine dinucleotide biosynthesis protein A
MDFFMAGKKITAYILAGGGSRRMGVDKLFLQVDGQSLLERAIAVCESYFGQVKLVSGDADKFSSLDYPVVLDSPKAKGPMAGVIAALEDCQSDSCFVTAADLLDLRTEILASIIAGYNGQQYFGLLESGGIQPLCGIYHKSALEVFYKFAKENNYGMTEAVKNLAHDGIIVPAGSWRNINCPEDLAIGGHGD